MIQLEYKTLSFRSDPSRETKSDDSDELQPNEFHGYASTFGGIDTYGDIIQKGAFSKTLEFFLENGVLLKEHKTSCAIGKPVECREDAAGLYLKGRISDTTDGRDCLTLLRDKVIRKMSIGFVTEGYEMLSEERAIEVLGSKDAYDAAIRSLPWYMDGQLRLITQAKLYEVSLVAFPANGDADILGVKSGRTDLRLTVESLAAASLAMKSGAADLLRALRGQ